MYHESPFSSLKTYLVKGNPGLYNRIGGILVYFNYSVHKPQIQDHLSLVRNGKAGYVGSPAHGDNGDLKGVGGKKNLPYLLGAFGEYHRSRIPYPLGRSR